MGLPRRTHVSEAQVHRVAIGQDTCPPDVDEHEPGLRRRPRDGRHIVDLIRALRSGIDPSGHAAGQAHQGPFFVSRIVRMQVDQTGNDDLPRRIDDLFGIARDVGLDRSDPA